MALISPILDDRTYEQLRDDLVRRIPTYTPESTNHNESDPGIALLELFATSVSPCSTGSTRSRTPPRLRSCSCSASPRAPHGPRGRSSRSTPIRLPE